MSAKSIYYICFNLLLYFSMGLLCKFSVTDSLVKSTFGAVNQIGAIKTRRGGEKGAGQRLALGT